MKNNSYKKFLDTFGYKYIYFKTKAFIPNLLRCFQKIKKLNI